jgi:hypothetical protein
MSTDFVLWLAIGSGSLAIAFGLAVVAWITAQSAGSERMQEIAAAIQAGARAYLNRQYTTIGMVGAGLFVILWLFLGIETRRRFCGRRDPLRTSRLYRHECVGARQCAHGAGSDSSVSNRRWRLPSAAVPSPECWWSVSV